MVGAAQAWPLPPSQHTQISEKLVRILRFLVLTVKPQGVAGQAGFTWKHWKHSSSEQRPYFLGQNIYVAFHINAHCLFNSVERTCESWLKVTEKMQNWRSSGQRGRGWWTSSSSSPNTDTWCRLSDHEEYTATVVLRGSIYGIQCCGADFLFGRSREPV